LFTQIGYGFRKDETVKSMKIQETISLSENGLYESQAPVTKGVVFNIQHFTIHDGPGIRTEIFLKGCALKCKWCSNPESIKVKQEIGVYTSRCIGIDKCGYCLEACAECDRGVFYRHNNKIAGIDQNICTNCLKCADACPSDAIVIWGNLMSVKEVMADIMSDMAFYEKSGGGVTISGGDPLIQWQFTLEILRQCRENGIHTCLETELHCQSSLLDKLFPYTDLVITDIKHMNPQKHREYTGVDNSLILGNILKTVKMKKPLIIRIPVVPGHNDDEGNIKTTAEFISKILSNNVLQVQLLPYRPLGLEKYESLNMYYPMTDLKSPNINAQKAELGHLVELMKSYGVPAVAGSSQKLSTGN
jgi:pyruvate formate lyase activating enzyme